MNTGRITAEYKMKISVYNDGRHKKVTTIIFYVIIDTKERKLIFMGRPKGGKNLYHSKEEKHALVYIQAY